MDEARLKNENVRDSIALTQDEREEQESHERMLGSFLWSAFLEKWCNVEDHKAFYKYSKI